MAVADLPELITVAELSAVTKLSPKTIRRAAKAGRIPALQLGPRAALRFDPEDVRRLMDERGSTR